MSRVKKGTNKNKKRKRLLKKAKGYRWGRKSKKRSAKQAVIKAGQYQYRDRRNKKRERRRQWQNIINYGVRKHGLSYSKFIHKLKENNIALNRKVLAEMVQEAPDAFERIVEKVK